MTVTPLFKQKKQDYFNTAQDFILQDNRTRRSFNPVSLEQMTKKHRVLFPDDFVKDKTILDLGCCLGATGHWCLSAGATHYVGVEAQKEYAEQGNLLLKKTHSDKGLIVHSSIEDFLEKNTETFDIVCALGVIYVFVDYYSVLKKITEITKESFVVEGLYPNIKKLGVDFCGVEFYNNQKINLATEDASLLGRGSRLSPRGLSFIMKDFGFETSGPIYPEKIVSLKDVYNSTFFKLKSAKRYLLIYNRSQKIKERNLSEDLNSTKKGLRKNW